MHNAIQISKLNDFIFSPKSIFYHSLYESFSELLYHDTPQVEGRAAHTTVDNQSYSSSTRYLQSTPIYSEKYNLVGKLDVYDKQEKRIIERKKKIKKLYYGHYLQVYAQYFCLVEAGYEVDAIAIHSLEDNKRYDIPVPGKKQIVAFEEVLATIRSFDIKGSQEDISDNKLDNCIYKTFYA